MSRIKHLFTQLKAQNKKALIPFFAGGDPTLQKTLAFMHAAVIAGADILEIGVPFSDPVADGPIIQSAYTRAIKQHVDLKAILQLIQDFRATNTHTPIVMMTYLHPIEVMGYKQFVQGIQKAGVDGVLIVDLPADSEHFLLSELVTQGVDPIFLLSPTTSVERMKIIAQKARGFLYYVSIKGITGTARPQVDIAREKVEQIRTLTELPIMVGFGIRDAKSAQDIAQIADGVVIGSAICTLIQESGVDAEGKLHAFLMELRQNI